MIAVLRRIQVTRTPALIRRGEMFRRSSRGSQRQQDLDTAAHVLALAQQTADLAIADAQKEAERIIARARQEAEQIIDEAKAGTEQA
jgi:F0F1-type ATP synthase membrane subunit b/b'